MAPRNLQECQIDTCSLRIRLVLPGFFSAFLRWLLCRIVRFSTRMLVLGLSCICVCKMWIVGRLLVGHIASLLHSAFGDVSLYLD